VRTSDQRIKKQVLYAARSAPHLVQPGWGDLLPLGQRNMILDKLMREKMLMSKILRSLGLF